VNAGLVEDDRGLLASTEAEWMAALTQLTGDVDARRAIGLNARSFVEREYSYQRWAPQLAQLFRSLD
jgi:hypothetical protein